MLAAMIMPSFDTEEQFTYRTLHSKGNPSLILEITQDYNSNDTPEPKTVDLDS